MKLLLLDFETTGIDPKTCRPVELAVLGWDTEKNETALFHKILWDESFGEIPEEAAKIHRIDTARARAEGIHPKAPLLQLVLSAERSDFLVAHNAAEYDKPLFEAECARWGIELPALKWIDTRIDLPYPPRMNCRKLSHLALDHGIVVDPSVLHGAKGDTLLMQELLKCYLQSLPEIAKTSQAPSLVVFAQVGYEGRELAKKEAFRWNPDIIRPDNGKKGAWVKKIRDFQLDEEIGKAALAGFKIKPLTE